MKRLSLFVLMSVFSAGLLVQPWNVVAEEPVAATVAATTDVEATMKKIGFNFKQAMQATEVPVMQEKVLAMAELVASVQAYQFTPEKQAVFQQGLDKVAAQLTLVQDALAKQDLVTAKQLLGEVDSLKKQYHKERSPSFWQLIFGG
ncbi:MAG: cytochrome b562 [Rheinheimera sp.]|nr:cytochrome b562 [Rheinheimera sp.]